MKQKTLTSLTLQRWRDKGRQVKILDVRKKADVDTDDRMLRGAACWTRRKPLHGTPA